MTTINLSMDDFRANFNKGLDESDIKYDNVTDKDSDKLKAIVDGALPEKFCRESFEFGVKAGSHIQGELTRRGVRSFAKRMGEDKDLGYLELKFESGLGRHQVSLARPDSDKPTDKETRALIGSSLTYTDVEDAVVAIEEVTADIWSTL